MGAGVDHKQIEANVLSLFLKRAHYVCLSLPTHNVKTPLNHLSSQKGEVVVDQKNMMEQKTMQLNT